MKFSLSFNADKVLHVKKNLMLYICQKETCFVFSLNFLCQKNSELYFCFNLQWF